MVNWAEGRFDSVNNSHRQMHEEIYFLNINVRDQPILGSVGGPREVIKQSLVVDPFLFLSLKSYKRWSHIFIRCRKRECVRACVCVCSLAANLRKTFLYVSFYNYGVCILKVQSENCMILRLCHLSRTLCNKRNDFDTSTFVLYEKLDDWFGKLHHFIHFLDFISLYNKIHIENFVYIKTNVSRSMFTRGLMSYWRSINIINLVMKESVYT